MVKSEKKNYITNRNEIIGNVEYLHEFYSVHLKNERDIIIWLPPSYHYSDKHYPVLYIQDGQNLFDPRTSFIGYDWKVDEVVTKLIYDDLINEIIVVGIYNNKDRLEEYNYFNEKGKKYSNFILNELKPQLDETYRTDPSASSTALMGSSMGGLISFQLFWNLPHVFGKAACLSNSFWIDDGEIFKMVEKMDTSLLVKNKLYVDCGTEEKELLPDFIKMIEILERKNFRLDDNLFHYLDIGSHHSERDWANRLHIPLLYLFGK